MHISDIKAIYFSDLVYANTFKEDFQKVSYGDAVYTLVEPESLISELEDHNNDGFDDESEGENYNDLIEELKMIPEGVLIALDG